VVHDTANSSFPHGYAATREPAMAAFAKSWRRELKPGLKDSADRNPAIVTYAAPTEQHARRRQHLRPTIPARLVCPF
jgi:hypothetical protein